MGKSRMSENEMVAEAVAAAYPKMRQLAAARKKLRDSEKTMFAALAQNGIEKRQFMEAWRRHEKDVGQLNLFDQMAMACETVMREIVSEQGPKPSDDKADEATETTKKSKAAKKTAGKKADADPKPKKVHTDSPENLPADGPRQSFRKAPAAGRTLQ